jgi:methionine synthase / methylenetetrahydrofolate reductase(NADPH)
VAEINAAGVRLARQAVEHLKDKQAGEAWVAGSVGPAGRAPGAAGQDRPGRSARGLCRADSAPWPKAGVDLLIIETMPALNEAREALEAAPAKRARSARAGDGHGGRREQLPGRLFARAGRGAADRVGRGAIGVNCSTGPATVLTAIEAMRAATTLPLAAMPNAGMPRAVEGRNIYLCSPEYMASFARKAIAAGAQIVGGCCGTTPNHIRAMRSAMRAIDAQARVWWAGARRRSTPRRRPRRWRSARASAR